MQRAALLFLGVLALAPASRAQQPSPADGTAGIAGVVRASNGTPLADTLVSLVVMRAASAGGLGQPLTFVTQADGRYEFADLAAGDYRVALQRFGYTRSPNNINVVDPETPQARSMLADGQRVTVDFTLQVPGSVSGLVTTGGGRPAPDAIVNIVRLEATGAARIVAASRADVTGRYLIEGIAPGSYVATTSTSPLQRGAGSPAEAAFTLDEGQAVSRIDVIATTVTPRARPSGDARVTGRVLTSASAPLGDATVSLVLQPPAGEPRQFNAVSTPIWTYVTGPDGAYQFEGLPAGDYIISTTKFGYYAPPLLSAANPDVAIFAGLFGDGPQATLQLFAGAIASEINITLRRPGVVIGTAFSEDGSPATGVAVTRYRLRPDGQVGIMANTGQTDVQGRFLVTDLQPGDHHFSLGPMPARAAAVDVARLLPVNVVEGGLHRGVDLIGGDLQPLTLEGRVVDADGRAPRAVQLEYGAPGATHRGLLSALGDGATFRISDREIKPGPISIMARAQTDDGPLIGLTTITAVNGRNIVEIVVAAPGAVRGRVSMPGGVAFTNVDAKLVLVREGFTPLGEPEPQLRLAPDGWVETGELLGEYRVRVDQPQMWTVKSITRRGVNVPNNRLIIRNGETLDDLEIVIGPR